MRFFSINLVRIAERSSFSFITVISIILFALNIAAHYRRLKHIPMISLILLLLFQTLQLLSTKVFIRQIKEIVKLLTENLIKINNLHFIQFREQLTILRQPVLIQYLLLFIIRKMDYILVKLLKITIKEPFNSIRIRFI